MKQRNKLNKLDLDSLYITVFSDWSFRGKDESSSQVGYIIFLTNKYKNADLIDYVTVKSCRVL